MGVAHASLDYRNDSRVDVEVPGAPTPDFVDELELLVLGLPGGKQHPDDDSQRVDVRAVVVAGRSRLLGRAEDLGAHTAAELIEFLFCELSVRNDVSENKARLRPLGAFSQAEVADLALSLEVQEDVVHLDVPVDDFAVVQALDSVDQVQDHSVILGEGRGVCARSHSATLIYEFVEGLLAELGLDVDRDVGVVEQPAVVDRVLRRTRLLLVRLVALHLGGWLGLSLGGVLLGLLGGGIREAYRGAVLAVFAVDYHLELAGVAGRLGVPVAGLGLDLLADLEPDGVILENVGVVDLAEHLALTHHFVEVLLQVGTVVRRFDLHLLHRVELVVQAVPRLKNRAKTSVADLLHLLEFCFVSLRRAKLYSDLG